VTKVSSLGMWAPVHDEEWDGDIPVGMHRPANEHSSSDSGIVVLKGELIPWTAGKYEIRYHHDGKYNVMAVSTPIEVYVNKPETITVASVRQCLLKIVPLCLDNDPHLVPTSCLPPWEIERLHLDDPDRDPDNFNFWSERQAKRICKVIKQAFDVEYATEVVVGDANVGSLAGRIVLSRELMGI
jgi:phosphatidylethanolamine N-methyltransferase